MDLNAEIEKPKGEISALTVEKDLLGLKLEHKEELIKYREEIIVLLRAKLND